MATLLEKAQQVAVKPEKRLDSTVDREELQLMVALTAGEVRRSQVAAVLGLKAGSVEGRRAVVFVKAVRAGLLAVPPYAAHPASRGPAERTTTPSA
ncbi:MAG TPA: hypothetical protein VIU40_14280 [Geobacteraceae bacterium]